MIDLSCTDIENLDLSIQSFGFGLLSGSIVPSVLRGLQEEAEERRSSALFAEQSVDLKYKANIVSLGPRALSFLCSHQMINLLSTIFGERFVLTEHRSCLTFYKEGDHLGPHLDKPAEECAVTIIVYVAVMGPAQCSSQTGLELRIYGQEAITTKCKPRLTISTETGGVVLGSGSKIWHERPMLEKEEQVTAITGCYRYAACMDDTIYDQAPGSEVSAVPGASPTPTAG